MPPPASFGGSANGAANAAGGGSGGPGAWAAPDVGRPPQPPPPPDDLPVLRLLQQGDLFGGGEEVPLLVPLSNGAVTNMAFDESYGEPQEALIERYLTLMGLAPPQQPPQHTSAPPPPTPPPPAEPPAAAAQRSGAAAATAGPGRPGTVVPDPNRSGTHTPAITTGGSADGSADGGADQESGQTGEDLAADEEQESEDDDDLVLSHRRHQRRQRRQQAVAAAALLSSSALAALGLDRPTLGRRGIPEALVGALHRGLAANAAAFFRTCVAEQRRLVALTRGSGPSVPLADRLLAFITGTEEHLKSGSTLPDLVDLRTARDTQAVLDAVSPPRPGPPVPFHHELMHQRQQPSPPPPEQPPPEEPSLSELLDLDKITSLAAAGNVPGLRALMRSLVSAADYSRTSLQQRLAAEGERAQRECARATDARQAADRLSEQLAARNAALAERGVELEAACRRASSAEEALVTERSTVSALRGQLRQLTADYEAQHRQLRAGLEAHLTRPASAKLLAQALAQPLGQSKLGAEAPPAGSHSAGPSPAGASDAEVHALGAQLATARAELALAELSCQQERAAARQLRVMLESARATVELHAGRAAAAGAEVERLNRLAGASRDLASASTGGLAILEQQLAQEKAAHRRTMERLQASCWKFEQARTCVVDVRARAAHNLRRLQTALADVNLRAVMAERQLADATVELRHTRRDLEEAKNSLAALRDRATRLEGEMEVLRNDAIAARLDSREVAGVLQETQGALRTAEARVTQMQQKVMEDADTVMAGRLASERLEVLEKDHEELQTSHKSLLGSHSALSATHSELQYEVAAMRVRMEELEGKEKKLEELTSQHEELKAAKTRLDQQYAATAKAKSLLSSELAGLKRHADVLAEQVQEYRRQSDGARLALEEEKEMHRHTREELSMTATRRDELETRCGDLSTALEGMETRMVSNDAEAARCRRTAELAGHQRAEAFAVRDAMSKVRMALTCDVKEYLNTIEGQVSQMTQCLDSLRSTLTGVQSRLLDMEPAILDGTTAEMPKVPYEESKKMTDALFKMVTHGSQLLETQSEIRKSLVERLEQLEDGVKERLATATDYWRQVLILSRGSPRSMIQMVEHMTGQACRELELDPINPLARMVPMGVLEEAGIQLNTQFERVGMLRDRADVSKAKGDAAAKLLEYEREVTSARTAEFQSLVDTLSREVNRLKQRVGSLEANNVMQQRATADMQRMLSDAEWKVSKALERETLLGIKFMVPHGRETKAVQTVFSDLYMMNSAAGPLSCLSPSASIAIGGPQPSTAAVATSTSSRPQLLQARSLGAPEMAAMMYDTGELLTTGGGGGDEAAAEYGGTSDVLGSPASLPPLSALNSPSTHAGTSWVAGSPRNQPPTQPHSGILSRPHSNLSKASSAMPYAPPSPMRCSSPDLPVGLGGQATAAEGGGDGSQPLPRTAFATASGCSAADAATGRSTSASTAPSSSSGGVVQGRPPPPSAHRRRRHPDEIPRRSGGSALSPVPSLNSMPSANSVASDGAATGGGGGGCTAAAAGGRDAAAGRGYTSDGHAGGVNSDDDYSSPSPCTSPPVLLRTPSAAASAKSGLPSGPMHHSRPATAGPPTNPWTLLPGSHSIGHQHTHQNTHPQHTHHPHSHHHHHAARLSGAVLHSSRPGSPVIVPLSPPTPSGIPHGWQHTPWDWLPDVTPLARSSSAVPYSRQALLEVIADVHYTKGLHDQVAAAASFPATSMQQYIGAYFEARHGPRGASPPAVELALAQLLVSLEAHSALYEVMLFARVAGLQAWTGKGAGRNGASRPATAQTSVKASAGGGFTRPRTPRVDAALSPYASAAVGALSPSRPGTAAAAAAARNSHSNTRTLSARNSLAVGGGGGGPASARNSLAVAGGGGGPVLQLGLVPSSRPSTAASPPLATAGVSGAFGVADGPDLILQTGGGETILRLRTGLSPAIAFSAGAGGGGGYLPYNGYNSHTAGNHPLQQSRWAGSTGALVPAASLPMQQQQQPQPSQQQPPKPQLRVRPELVVSEQLSQLLARLGEVSGMEALCQFISTGRLLGRLRPADLGQALPEEAHPELHFTVQRVCGALGLHEAPELLVRQSLPYGADVMLLQLPSVSTSALGLLAQGDVDRQPVMHPAAAPSAAAGGWRRRAVLLLTPALVAAAAPATLREPGAPLDGEELQAVLGAALAPIVMPGGVGWRFDVQTGASAMSGGSGGASSAVGGPAAPAASTTSSASSPAPTSTSPNCSPPTLLSAAEVITAVNVAALKPRAVPSVLPSQLQFKWERLLAHLRSVAAAATASADRGALLATQNMAAAVRAVFRAAAGISLQDGGQLGNGEELVLQAQTMPFSDDQILGMATMPMHDAAAEGGETRRGYALSRVAVLARWAEAPEYRQTLRSAVM